MVGSRRMAWAVAATIAVVAIAGTAAMAADSGIKIGVVNIQKIYKDAPRVKQYMEQLEALRQELGIKLEVRSQNLMLDDTQVKELIDLKLKPAPTDKDKARIKEIEDSERALDAEFKKLQSTAQPSEQEKARLKTLQDLEKKSQTTGTALEKDYNSHLTSTAQELDEKARVDMKEAINKVVESKGFTLVIAQDAVMYGGTDITDEVIKNMDRKPQ